MSRTPSRLPDRRTIAKGAAWTVPALTISSPALAASASEPKPLVSIDPSRLQACEVANPAGDVFTYKGTVCFNSNDAHTVTIVPSSAHVDGNLVTIVSVAPNPLTIAPGGSGCQEIVAQRQSTTPMTSTLDATFTVTDSVTGRTAQLTVVGTRGQVGSCIGPS